MRGLALAVCVLSACGQVSAKKMDASVVDVPDPDALTCPQGEMACPGCINVQSDPNHCGSCTTQCTSTQVCLTGHCVRPLCGGVRDINPGATDGAYPDPANPSHQMYCDFTGNTTYEALGMGNYMVTYMGFSIVTLADFQKPNFPAAFITLYNSQGGMPALEAWHSGNCCFTTTGGADFKFSGDHPQPATAGGLMCNQSPTYNTPPYFFYMLGAVQAPPLPATFFSGGVTTDTACQDGVGSPAFFVRKSTIN